MDSLSFYYSNWEILSYFYYFSAIFSFDKLISFSFSYNFDYLGETSGFYYYLAYLKILCLFVSFKVYYMLSSASEILS